MLAAFDLEAVVDPDAVDMAPWESYFYLLPQGCTNAQGATRPVSGTPRLGVRCGWCGRRRRVGKADKWRTNRDEEVHLCLSGRGWRSLTGRGNSSSACSRGNSTADANRLRRVQPPLKSCRPYWALEKDQMGSFVPQSEPVSIS